MNETPRPQIPKKVAGHLFYNLCVAYGLDLQAMQEIADSAQVHMSVVGQMFVNLVVRRVDAESVLAAFSKRVGTTWTLDTVKVALLPTFADLQHLYQFDLSILARTAGVEKEVISRMMEGKPVHQQEAYFALQAVSRMANERLTLETVDIPVEVRALGLFP